MIVRTSQDRLWQSIVDSFDVDDILPLLEYILDNCRVPANTESPGPFDSELVPHVPEIIEQIDDPNTEEILMDWATRNAKTFTAIFILVAWVAQTNAPCGAASASLGLRDKLISEKLYPALEACVATAGKIPPPHLRSPKEAWVGDSLISTAISDSPKTLASFPAQLALINEAGLWKINSIQRMRQRMRNFGRSGKMVIEGKPEDLATCTITKLINEPGVQRRIRHCRCPHCRTYQPLVWGSERPGPGIKWERKDNRQNVAHAMKTVHYQCVNGCKIHDGFEREAMLKDGKWVPEGQEIDKLGRLRGDPDVPSVRRVAFYRLSSLYSLLADSWAQVVGEFFDCKDDPELLREFTTGTLGIPWDPKPINRQPEAIAKNLHCATPYGIAPIWAKFITVAVDVGHDPGDDTLEFFCSVAAWGGPNKKPRGHWTHECHFEHGQEDEFIEWITSIEIPHEDGGVMLPRGTCMAIDSGDGEVSEKIVILCEIITAKIKASNRPNAECLPLKGDSAKNVKLNWFSWGDTGKSKREKKRNTKKDRGTLIMVNSARTQSWRVNCISGMITAEQRDFMSIPREYYEDWETHEDMLSELAADYQDEKGRWVKGGKNERGDLFRYHRSIASVRTKKDTIWHKLSRNPNDRQRKQTRKPATPTQALEQAMVDTLTVGNEHETRSIEQILKGLVGNGKRN